MIPERLGQVSDDGDRKKGTDFGDVCEIKAAGLGNGLDMEDKGDGVVRMLAGFVACSGMDRASICGGMIPEDQIWETILT